LQVALPDSGEKADLPKLFGASALWDGSVLLGKEKLPVRLIAVRMPKPAAAERRRLAQSNRDRRLHHSREYFQLLDWRIFITNVPPQMLAAPELVKLYELRWRIEIIFKAWKSHFKLTELTDGSAEQMLVVVLGKLIWISWFSVQFTEFVARSDNMSILKMAAWCSKFAYLLFQTIQPTPESLGKLITYYCRYEKRKTRLNFLEKCATLS